MTRIRGEWCPAMNSVAIILSSAIGMATLFSTSNLIGQETVKPGAGKSKPDRSAAREPDLIADLDEAIRILEQGDFRTFFERYAPVEALRNLRQQDLVERAALVMSNQPKTKRQLLDILNNLRKQTPTYDKSRGLATIQFEKFVSSAEEIGGELHLPDMAELKLIGLGDDLNKVIAEAIRLLAAGDARTFIERLFPASEMARLQESGAMEELLQQFKVGVPNPNTFPPTRLKNIDPPTVLEAMQADLKRLQPLTPDLTDNGKVAVFRLAAQEQQPARVLKFQKMENDWRFFDDVGRVTAELTRQSKLKPRAAMTIVQMELIGGNWRFIELPALQLGGK